MFRRRNVKRVRKDAKNTVREENVIRIPLSDIYPGMTGYAEFQMRGNVATIKADNLPEDVSAYDKFTLALILELEVQKVSRVLCCAQADYGLGKLTEIRVRGEFVPGTEIEIKECKAQPDTFKVNLLHNTKPAARLRFQFS